MSEDYPFLKFTNTEGSFSQIPVFEVEVSGGTIQKLSPTKVQIGITGGSSGTGGGSISVPLIISSGGTGTTQAGSATVLVGMNSSASVYDYYNLVSSNNVLIVRSANSYVFSSSAGGGARVYHSSNQLISSGSFTPLVFDSERYDTDGYHSTASNTDRLTAPVKGIYEISGTVKFSSGGTGVRDIGIRHNTSNYIALDRRSNAGTTLDIFLSISTLYEMNANDFVTLNVQQNNGTTITLVQTDAFSPEFSIQLLRAT